jgi:hypothetical protein
MNSSHEDRMGHLLRQALPPICDAEPERDLWPAMLRRLESRRASPPWFDWALAGALAIFVIVFPASIPVFLYYL